MTTRKNANLTADTAYNDMLLSFRDAGFRLAAYKALVLEADIGASVSQMAEAMAKTVDLYKTVIAASIEKEVVKGTHVAQIVLDECVVLDKFGRPRFTDHFHSYFHAGYASQREVDAAIEAAVSERADRLIEGGRPAAFVDDAIRKLDFEFEVGGWSVVVGSHWHPWKLPRLFIELRPELGGEYPAVLRAMRRRLPQDNDQIGLIVQRLSGAETLETVRWVFGQGSAKIVTMAEIAKAALA